MRTLFLALAACVPIALYGQSARAQSLPEPPPPPPVQPHPVEKRDDAPPSPRVARIVHRLHETFPVEIHAETPGLVSELHPVDSVDCSDHVCDGDCTVHLSRGKYRLTVFAGASKPLGSRV